MEGVLQVRLSKSGRTLFKNRTYEVKVNGSVLGHIDADTSKLENRFPAGKCLIEIGESGIYVKKETILRADQLQVCTINPSLTYAFFRGFLIGIAIVTLLVQFIVLDKISIPLMLIPIIPILVFRKENYSESFAITLRKNSL